MGRATSRWAPSATPSASTSRNNLSESLKSEWRASKVRKLASVMVDEILERGREGMDCFVAGVCPLEFWPELLAAAAEIARKETGRPYEIAPSRPTCRRSSRSTRARTRRRWASSRCITRRCNAAPGRFMSVCHRKRLDAALSWVHTRPLLAVKTYTTEYSFFAGALRERICFSALLTYYLLTLLLTYLLTDILNYLLTYLLYSRVLPPAKLSNRQYGAQSSGAIVG